MGGTELLDALNAVVEARDSSCPCDVVILTDGQFWRLDSTLNLVQKTRKESKGAVRFFALGIGSHASHALVEGIANRGGGYSEVIPQATQGGWEDRVVAMLKAALTTHVQPLELDFDTSGALSSPANMGDLNPFQGNRVFVLLNPEFPQDHKTITVKTRTIDGEDISHVLSLDHLQSADSTIHSLAARQILDDLGRVTEPRAQAEEIAYRYSLMSKWKSFVLEQEKYEPKGDDPFTDAIIRVDEAANTDAHLKPRGLRQPRRLQKVLPAPEDQPDMRAVEAGATPTDLANLPSRSTDYHSEPDCNHTPDGFAFNPGGQMATSAYPPNDSDDTWYPVPAADSNVTEQSGDSSNGPGICTVTRHEYDGFHDTEVRVKHKRPQGKRKGKAGLGFRKRSPRDIPDVLSSVPPPHSQPYLHAEPNNRASAIDYTVHGSGADILHRRQNPSCSLFQEESAATFLKGFETDLCRTSPSETESTPPNDRDQDYDGEPVVLPDGAMLFQSETAAHKQFVTLLLAHQNFDGSFAPSVRILLGPDIEGVRQEMVQYIKDQSHIDIHIDNPNTGTSPSATADCTFELLAYVLLTAALLERDYQDCKNLWALMRMKASQYISRVLPDLATVDELTGIAGKKLKGKTVDVRVPGEVGTADAGPDGRAEEMPEYVVVHTAPMD